MTPHSGTFGSAGERLLQNHLGSAERAAGFYGRQVQPQLTPQMREFIRQQNMVFISTADAGGECDASFRAGPPGFVVDLDQRTLTYPEYRGNGVLASAGNVTENPHMGLLFIDFTHHHIGLHVNGRALLRTDEEQRRTYPRLPVDTAPGRRPDLWVHLVVEEAYVHCSKHIPHLEPAQRPRLSPDSRPKDAEYFVAPRPPAPPSQAPVPVPARHYGHGG
ncbi:putative pyridoxine 5'-phosphate oxidase superfamily flavin-nucleotide-binding protein [Streptomyces sp. V4I23]|uniref:pyridoxamine 5'-phosphate oxidase family protein n=1 Tax=Streptomyces sp. V4I23 TaxID=3042282 RepID=UPI00277D77D1|nr:pyridoxamine 5'-phosphate oxidase family protein [Streptomyces sp. V4I23]MDQ1012771.1 putative pyridoxine 5'-phosphate oxidase superfamily flavin-nucleotide-binding protein [Streptomyces sp. V4I23]